MASNTSDCFNGTILIIEDNPLNLDMARELLEHSGFKTLQATESDDGIILARQNKPDLILMDMHMPHRNGYETTQLLKADPETGRIPVVAFTALAMDSDLQKARDAGCVGTITKPIDVSQFAKQVNEYLRQKKTQPPQDPAQATDCPTLESATASTETAVLTTARQDTETLTLPKHELKQLMLKLSHDIQSATSKIETFTSMLESSAQGKLNEKEQDYFERLVANANKLREQTHGLIQEFRTRHHLD